MLCATWQHEIGAHASFTFTLSSLSQSRLLSPLSSTAKPPPPATPPRAAQAWPAVRPLLFLRSPDRSCRGGTAASRSPDSLRPCLNSVHCSDNRLKLGLAQPHHVGSPHSDLLLLQRSARRPAVAVEIPALSRRCSLISHEAATVLLSFATCHRRNVQRNPASLPLLLYPKVIGVAWPRFIVRRPKEELIDPGALPAAAVQLPDSGQKIRGK
ncbi:hypothetical protein AAHA92_00328 [Salvia divinorum]|uniref:Uncharacterized protein n=1 Tax=Salvia divinorum TaxID=28513 RepID=A0ABD1ILZ2_SALDI